MSDQKPFSERLVWARAEAGITQRELAKKAGISVPQIVRYEAGKSMPRLGAALKLARALNVDAYDLMPELKKTTHEVEIEFSSEEAAELGLAAAELGITTEELIRGLTVLGLALRAKDPERLKRLEAGESDIELLEPQIQTNHSRKARKA